MEFLVLHKREIKIQSLPSLCAKTSHQPFPTECVCPGSSTLLPHFNHSDRFRLFFPPVNWIWIKDFFLPAKQYLLWILGESQQSSVRLDSSSSPKTLRYQRPAMINSLLGKHSLRELNTVTIGYTCSKDAGTHTGHWHNTPSCRSSSESQPLTWKYFSSLNDRSRTAWKKSQSFVPEITVLSYSNPEGSSKVLSYQMLFSLRRKCKRSNNKLSTQESAKMLPPNQRAEGGILPDTRVPPLTKSCHSPCM